MSEIQSNLAQPAADARIGEERRAELVNRAGRFRILIVGRANAGKTTILKKICNTTDDPEIYNSQGKKVCGLLNRSLIINKDFLKIDISKIEPTAKVITYLFIVVRSLTPANPARNP